MFLSVAVIVCCYCKKLLLLLVYFEVILLNLNRNTFHQLIFKMSHLCLVSFTFCSLCTPPMAGTEGSIREILQTHNHANQFLVFTQKIFHPQRLRRCSGQRHHTCSFKMVSGDEIGLSGVGGSEGIM